MALVDPLRPQTDVARSRPPSKSLVLSNSSPEVMPAAAAIGTRDGPEANSHAARALRSNLLGSATAAAGPKDAHIASAARQYAQNTAAHPAPGFVLDGIRTSRVSAQARRAPQSAGEVLRSDAYRTAASKPGMRRNEHHHSSRES